MSSLSAQPVSNSWNAARNCISAAEPEALRKRSIRARYVLVGSVLFFIGVAVLIAELPID